VTARTDLASVTGCGWRSGRGGRWAVATGSLHGAASPTGRDRWPVEECFKQAKQETGLDDYQVRTWRGWYAHITLSMLALAWLAAVRAAEQQKGEPPLNSTSSSRSVSPKPAA
jgi:hypothetical protein